MSTARRRTGVSPFVGASIALHAAAVPVVVAVPRIWPWVAGSLVADHCVLLVGGLIPRNTLLGPNLVRSEAAAAAGAVVLTFDDGPDPAVTPRVLDLLDAHGARATFFCIGERIASQPDLAREIARRGHRIENHTQTHRNLFFFHLPATLEREIDACQEAVLRVSDRAPAYFRAPAGIRSPLLQGVLSRTGLRLASWTRRGFDTIARDPGLVAARLTRGLAAGDVLVLHDGARHPRAGRERVVLEALPRVLDAIGAAGLRAAPLPDEPEARPLG
jgi:peptidoglycan/xylan/chitin deacetylase (PgdA/CDA1 family)